MHPPTAPLEAPTLDTLVDGLLQTCTEQQIDPARLLMELQLRLLWDDYLSRIPPREQWAFAVRLIKRIEAADQRKETGSTVPSI